MRYALRLGATLALLAAAMAPAATVAAESGATIGFAPTVVEVGQGATSAVAVRIQDVTGLYGVDLKLRFDPATVEVADADPSRDGVQLQLGDFLEPGLVVSYEADNQAGTARLVLTQVNPAVPKSGSGTLCTLVLRGMAAGSTAGLQVEGAELSTQTGDPIAVSTTAGEVRVVAAAQAPATPTLAPTVQAVLDLPTQAADEPAPTTPATGATQPVEPTTTPTLAPVATAADAATAATATAAPVDALAPTATAAAAEAATVATASETVVVPVVATAVLPVEPTAAPAAVGSAPTAEVAEITAAGAATATVAVAPTATPQALALAGDAAAPTAAPTQAALTAVGPSGATGSLWFILAAVAGLIAATGGLLVVAQSKRRRA
ncbi:MAG: cohesin domain-containing protein [Anaerolineae bacterium]